MPVKTYRPTAEEKTLFDDAKKSYKDKNYVRASEILMPLVENGYPKACILLGEQYYKGLGVTKNALKAETLYNLAISDPYESKNAYIGLCTLYSDKWNGIYNAEKAEKIMLEGCRKHITECYNQYAKFLTSLDRQDAYAVALKSIKCGNTQTYVTLGDLLCKKNKCSEKDGYDTNFILASECYKMSINAGKSVKEAKKGIARLISRKLVKPSDFPQSLEYAMELADGGDREMELFAFKVHSMGLYGYKKNTSKAEKYIKLAMNHRDTYSDTIVFYVEAALKGNISDANRQTLYSLLENYREKNVPDSKVSQLMAIMKYHGIATQQNESEALNLFKESMKINNIHDIVSRSYIAKIQIDGRVTTQNISEGLKTLNSIINDQEIKDHQKNIAYYLVATRCIFGENCERDFSLANKLLKKTSPWNYPVNLLPIISMSVNCFMELNNVNNHRNDEVMRILRKSINCNDPWAQEKYAELYENIDPVVSLEYYRKSVKCNSSTAQQKIDKLLTQYPDLSSNDEDHIDKHSKEKISYLEKVSSTLAPTDAKKCNALVNKLKDI
jgi:TPR repeat protein